MPETSVVLPTRDGWPLLPRAVTSTLADLRGRDADLVIVDDGSTDRSVAWLDALSDGFPQVRVVRTTGVGLAGALNAGLAATSSRFVARMDADDIWLPDRLERQLAVMRSRPELSLIGCQVIRMVGGQEASTTALPLAHEDIVASLLRGEHAMCHPATFMRRSALEAVGGYWDQGLGEEMDIFLRLGRVGRVANLPFVGLKYRIHGSGINADRQYELQAHMAYAAAAHRRPRGDLSFDEFAQHLADHPVRRLDLRRRALGLSLYRSGLAALHGEGRGARGRLYLAAGGLLMPERATQHVVRRLRRPALRPRGPEETHPRG